MGTESHHPTRERLVATLVSMLDENPPEKWHVDDVLLRSGVSKGSMYYHFEDFSDLIDAAFVYRFSQHVDANIEWISGLLATADSRDSFFDGLHQLTVATQGKDRAAIRMERARVLGMAAHNERLRALLAHEQGRLTGALTDLVREAQAKGWLSVDVDSHALAVFIQAYTLGQIVNDVTEDEMSRDAWVSLIDRIVARALA
jgi:AcrR family transcriptional regulator